MRYLRKNNSAKKFQKIFFTISTPIKKEIGVEVISFIARLNIGRKVLKTAHGPFKIKLQKQPVWICMCGLSKNQPFCDGSYMMTLDEQEGKIYQYRDDRTRME